MIPRPFESEEENKKFETLYKKINTDINEMILSKDPAILKYIEMIVSSVILEFNKKFPEPNYSFYMTYRIKSPKSNIDKLNDYLSRKNKNDELYLKDIPDLIGLRLIIEKIPHNISIGKNNPEYKTFDNLISERKTNIKKSAKFHNFEVIINDGHCSNYEYYTNCKNLLTDILKMLESSTLEPNYAKDLKETYKKLLGECNKKIEFLEIMGDYSSKVNVDKLNSAQTNQIVFEKLLEDFDSRIDSNLALKLYSNSFREVIKNSKDLNNLGVTVSNNSNRTKSKQEKSGFISNFFGLDFKDIPIKCECQIMSVNEYIASCIGYSAHSNMPGKSSNLSEIPTAYANRHIGLLKNLGNSNFISNDELDLINKISEIKAPNKNYANLIKELTSYKNVIVKNNIPIGVNINSDLLPSLKDFCHINPNETEFLKKEFEKRGIKNFQFWANNISAQHAIARLDKDSSAKNRVKIHYNTPYECLAHVIRQQVEGYNLSSSSDLIESYLSYIYKNQDNWFEKNLNSTESSIMDFEIEDFITNDLFTLRNKFLNKDNERS